MCVVLLFAFAIKPQMSGMRRLFSVTAVLLLFAAALFDAYSYYTMLQEAKIQADVPLPFSLHAAAALAVVFAGVVVGAGRTVRKGRNLVVGLSTLMVCFIGFPLAHMFCFGTTDFRAPADAVIVFANGPDGEAISSETMTERITTAAELYQEEFARKVVLCGASNEEASDRSPETMQQAATRLGVPEADILLCPTDLDTSSIQATNDLLEQQGIGEVLVASQFYDIPRFKLEFHRLGTQIRTVPADQPLPLPELRPILQREFIALWQIQLEPLRELINRL